MSEPTLPMFPLGSVLFPFMPLQLRVFEERYLTMLSHILELDPAEFGVVLIERGQEVGGGEQRFSTGTVAQIIELDTDEGFVTLVAVGERRVVVGEWLAEDPYPAATVRELPELQWDAALESLRDDAELVVRRTLALAAEYSLQQWPPDLVLSEDPVAAVWQLAGISPLGPIDQIALLRAETAEQLLTDLIEFTIAAEEALNITWPDEEV
ncbi:LON peptidase substrate-binding domain-containing protein [Subtercola vilae]|nr:LON peptidase substrate-binding domain-containing protein [Subtercola vilae]